MLNDSLLGKILSVPEVTVTLTPEDLAASDVVVGEQLTHAVRSMFNGALAIREVAAGSSNAEEQECVALGNAYYDLEQYGIHFVASPRHADMLFVSGPVARNMAEPLRRTYNQTPDPKIVVAIGDGAIDGGLLKGSYAATPVKDIIPVHFAIPGNPPSPRAIIRALLKILNPAAA